MPGAEFSTEAGVIGGSCEFCTEGATRGVRWGVLKDEEGIIAV